MMTFPIICSLLLLSYIVIEVQCQQFNIYKSYKDAKVKPPQYSKKDIENHSISEYLSPLQKSMMKKRNGKNTPDAMTNGKFSGFDPGYNIKNYKRTKMTPATPLIKKETVNNMIPTTQSAGITTGTTVNRRLSDIECSDEMKLVDAGISLSSAVAIFSIMLAIVIIAYVMKRNASITEKQQDTASSCEKESSSANSKISLNV